MRPRKKRRLLELLAALALLLGLAAADSNLRLVTTYYRLSFPGLPAGFAGYRILQLSDLHGAVFGQDNARLLEAVRATEPDLIALTGDLADESTDLSVIDALLGQLAAIAAGCECDMIYTLCGNGGEDEDDEELPEPSEEELRAFEEDEDGRSDETL